VVLQRAIEEAGIPTVMVASLPTICAQLGAPRIGATDTPMGAVFGPPGDAKGQRRVLRQALGLLESATVPGAVADLGLSYRTAL
jgi:D-proline reductase (dithiol) PrdA